MSTSADEPSAASQPDAPPAANSIAADKAAPNEAPTADVPDPDSDDLDELDDMLDEFSSTTAAQKPSCSGPGRPAPAAKGKPTTVKAKVDDNEDGINEDFQAQLAQSMAELMGEIDDSPEKRKQLDALMAGLTSEMDNLAKNGDSKAAGATSSNDPAASTTTDDVFQETIRKTLERMQVSEEQASAAATAATEAGAEDPLLQQLLQEMAAQGMGGEGKEGGDEEFSKMLLSMMEQLTNKDILYEPMKELHDKFPEWMKKNKGKVGEADMVRYREQRRLVEEIVDRFEREGYADENPQDREYIVERMQKMQAAGSPPKDLVGDLDQAQEVLGDLDGGCAQQ